MSESNNNNNNNANDSVDVASDVNLIDNDTNERWQRFNSNNVNVEGFLNGLSATPACIVILTIIVLFTSLISPNMGFAMVASGMTTDVYLLLTLMLFVFLFEAVLTAFLLRNIITHFQKTDLYWTALWDITLFVWSIWLMVYCRGVLCVHVRFTCVVPMLFTSIANMTFLSMILATVIHRFYSKEPREKQASELMNPKSRN